MAFKMTANSNQVKDAVYRLPPQCYLHVLDSNTNITRLEIGPQTYVRKDHESVVVDVTSMINIPPQHYCEIANPVVRDDKNEVVHDSSGGVKLNFGDTEVRLAQEPFPLYPGEILRLTVRPLKIVKKNHALKLKAMMDIEEETLKVLAGDEWLFEGPGIYIPNKAVEVIEEVKPRVIKINHALRIRATNQFVDRSDTSRVTGEEWLIKKVGSYIPDAYEEVVEDVEGIILTEKRALHLKALKTFVDEYGITRKSGEEWLVSISNADVHIPGVYEEIQAYQDITTLTNRQYCVILNPVDSKGRPQLGRRKLIKGEKSFFLLPGESLETGIEDIYVLSENDGLILRATEEYMDGDKKRLPGDRWLVRGPLEMIPPIEVQVVCERKAIALDKNEGVYVRDINSGHVRSVIGHTYMLTENEELWEKNVRESIEELLVANKDPLAGRNERSSSNSSRQRPRDKKRVITFQVPHNAAVQIYDYKDKSARIHYGPDLVMLGPDEEFTELNLSGGKPKRPNQIKSLCLLLGPDFCTDIVTVETADHAKLSLQVAYNWHFKVGTSRKRTHSQLEDKSDPDEGTRLFSVPDFVGDACKAMASRIRGTVAAVPFDDFHKNSARIIRSSVFGVAEDGKVREEFIFRQNSLVITNIDIQSVEPVDQKTRDSLQKSVQLAIEITTKSQEASARQEAERLEQQARGRLKRQMINDQSDAEEARKRLLELEATSAAVESTGQAKAEAQSRAEAAKIEHEASVEKAQLKAKADSICSENELKRVKAAREAELDYRKKMNELEEIHMQKMLELEVGKFRQMVDAVGANTLVEMARAGPDSDVRLLKSLGLKTTLVTDGTSPVNLFKVAHDLVGQSIMGAPISTGPMKKDRKLEKEKLDITEEEDDEDDDDDI